MYIEKLAVNYLEIYIGMSDCIQSFFNVNDKEPFYDGKIMIYKSVINKDYIGYLNVQIKGQTVDENELNIKEISYPVKIKDLKAYQNDNGCIFFVVNINNKCKYSIYFNILTPLKIKELLDNNNISTKNVVLELVPQNVQTFNYLIKEGLKDCKIQNKQINVDSININDISKIKYNDFGIFANIERNMINDLQFIYDYPHTFYLKSNNDITSIKGKTSILSISNNIDLKISINNTEYYNNVYKTETKDFIEWRFGRAFAFRLNRNNAENKADLNISFNSNNYLLSDYLIDIKFLIELIESKTFTISNGKNNSVILVADELLGNFDLCNCKRIYSFANEIKAMLNILELNNEEQLYIDKLDLRSNNLLNLLVNSILKNEPVINDMIDGYNPFMTMEIANICLIVYVERIDDAKNMYRIHKVSEKNFECFYESDDKKSKRKVSYYYILTSDNFAQISNLNYTDIYNSYIEVGNIDDINECVLKLLIAYDKCNKIKLLCLAEELIHWSMHITDNNYLYNCLKLNLLQIKKRKNKELKYEDKEYLNTILYDSSYDNNLKIGAAIILGNKNKVDELFEKYTWIEKDNFIKLPIYNLYKVM